MGDFFRGHLFLFSRKLQREILFKTSLQALVVRLVMKVKVLALKNGKMKRYLE